MALWFNLCRVVNTGPYLTAAQVGVCGMAGGTPAVAVALGLVPAVAARMAARVRCTARPAALNAAGAELPAMNLLPWSLGSLPSLGASDSSPPIAAHSVANQVW